MPQIIPIIAAAAQGGKLIYDVIRAGKLNRMAKEALPPSTDPQEATTLAMINNLRKGRTTGAAYGEARRQLGVQGAAVMDQITRTGGSSGAMLSALSNVGRGTGDTFGKIFSDEEATRMRLSEQTFNQMNRMSMRRAGIDMMRYAQATADKKQADQTLQDDIWGLISTLPEIDVKKSTPKPRYAEGGDIPKKEFRRLKKAMWLHALERAEEMERQYNIDYFSLRKEGMRPKEAAKTLAPEYDEYFNNSLLPKGWKKTLKKQIMGGTSPSPDPASFEDGGTSEEDMIMVDKQTGEIQGEISYGENVFSKHATEIIKMLSRNRKYPQLGRFVADELKRQPKNA